MNLQRVTYVSEHLLPLTPVYTAGEGLGERGRVSISTPINLNTPQDKE
ncbi:MAG: hypothetical protein JAY88_21515 [Candidatus Thiodiazotropha lotti]|nr:hypothetical protein [Candidatus Thiodiazotropha lotti]MCW4189650.1 hypothetical protein [Candidatus Thiodiazotropha lotti]